MEKDNKIKEENKRVFDKTKFEALHKESLKDLNKSRELLHYLNECILEAVHNRQCINIMYDNLKTVRNQCKSRIKELEKSEIKSP